ncbi:RNA polymerase sigma factor [Ferdinandcohnia quinoae]|uniref:Sigma-70 family RNA polymerase sigma factor n=1 Tax=Fredinandcohnia quinoae TaxID=2918902 RepID=A0AAW5EAJ6_9BACI|nr:sigma-70 family RNA polymerase sigma factor [Fredinandcohnia sp. SECRCQ15]MCH1627051.1 sigma-70 family RNA polymerase sigma factor [Fredinandcohnia sp. SECRCQ15]
MVLIRELFQKLFKKDQQAERILFEMFYNRVYRTAYMITNDHYLAEDVVQETFEKAFKALHKLKEPEKAGAWLGTIASTTAIDMIRKKKRRNDIATEDVYIDKEMQKIESDSIVEAAIEEQFYKEIVRSNISKLKPEYKQVIILKYIYDMKDEEIANQLELKVGTVKSRIYRAKLMLKDSIGSSIDVKEGGL